MLGSLCDDNLNVEVPAELLAFESLRDVEIYLVVVLVARVSAGFTLPGLPGYRCPSSCILLVSRFILRRMFWQEALILVSSARTFSETRQLF